LREQAGDLRVYGRRQDNGALWPVERESPLRPNRPRARSARNRRHRPSIALRVRRGGNEAAATRLPPRKGLGARAAPHIWRHRTSTPAGSCSSRPATERSRRPTVGNDSASVVPGRSRGATDSISAHYACRCEYCGSGPLTPGKSGPRFDAVFPGSASPATPSQPHSLGLQSHFLFPSSLPTRRPQVTAFGLPAGGWLRPQAALGKMRVRGRSGYRRFLTAATISLLSGRSL